MVNELGIRFHSHAAFALLSFALVVGTGCEDDEGPSCGGDVSVVMHNETAGDLTFKIVVDRPDDGGTICEINRTIDTDLGGPGEGLGNYDLKAGDQLTITGQGLCATCEVTADGEASEYVTLSFIAGTIDCAPPGLTPAAACF